MYFKAFALTGRIADCLYTQGNALGFVLCESSTPCKGKSFTYRRGFSIFIRCILKLLPLQGASLIAIIPRAMPWAKSFCPFRACCCGLFGLQGDAVYMGFLAFRACCCGFLDLTGRMGKNLQNFNIYFLSFSRYFRGEVWRCSLTYLPKKEVLEKPRIPEISFIDLLVDRR